MKKLFKVPMEITFNVLVVGETPEEAKQLAKDNVLDELNRLSLWDIVGTGHVHEITKSNQIPSEWKGEPPYYGDEGEDKPSEKWLEEIEEAKRKQMLEETEA